MSDDIDIGNPLGSYIGASYTGIGYRGTGGSRSGGVFAGIAAVYHLRPWFV